MLGQFNTKILSRLEQLTTLADYGGNYHQLTTPGSEYTSTMKHGVNKIQSFETILAELTLLNDKLPNHRLDQFSLFNEAYYLVTNSIKLAVQENYFRHPEFIEEFSTRFAWYYFQAIDGVIKKDSNTPVGWAILAQISQHKNIPNFITLLMGANAHINHDLPLVLVDLMDQEKSTELFEDLKIINKLLFGSGKEIIRIFDESNKSINFIKQWGQFLYYRPIMYLILYWRLCAWQNYKSILEENRMRQTYSRRSSRIARHLLLLGILIGTIFAAPDSQAKKV